MNKKDERMEKLRAVVSMAAFLAIGAIFVALQQQHPSSEIDMMVQKAAMQVSPKKVMVHKAASKKMNPATWNWKMWQEILSDRFLPHQEAKKALLHAAHHKKVVPKQANRLNTVKKYITHVARQDATVRDQVREVIKAAEATEKEQMINVDKKSQKAAKGSKVKSSRVPRKLSKNTLKVMEEARRAGWAADEAAREKAKAEAKSYYNQLRKEMFARVKAKQERARKILIASKNMSASQDNKKLLNDLDAIYSKDGPLPHKNALATSNSTKTHLAAEHKKAKPHSVMSFLASWFS
ncbi:hypothetical protein GUITHDRAFT_144315 [Guillardia theta CCMP2712]|uniref:Uncharacterized protein n=1 Tax=Guillardia theta (strain CCMP2712) TaxID=905079 RepID=L1IR76_GUITC|nr:hypothetical protein GUITHDRAFT_144315 [Guillardia theta CCMP2712]EKX38389.1 hypothetical protein GUITHDRAFT_144315 [Guillardia theta CCMP2712]|eukprot:XP_005825369.1 hypothetical protein GUITHDRAFT_144315 [Guillardia theta CCMP2712]